MKLGGEKMVNAVKGIIDLHKGKHTASCFSDQQPPNPLANEEADSPLASHETEEYGIVGVIFGVVLIVLAAVILVLAEPSSLWGSAFVSVGVGVLGVDLVHSTLRARRSLISRIGPLP
jgi:hypothetical protein